MNPASQTLRAQPSIVQDIRPPTPIKAEVVNSIPVRAQAAPGSQLANAAPLNNTEPASHAESKNLDKLLTEVNKDVKKIDEPKKARFSLDGLKSAGVILPVLIAVAVAAVLIVASLSAFKSPAEHVRTRATAQLVN